MYIANGLDTNVRHETESEKNNIQKYMLVDTDQQLHKV